MKRLLFLCFLFIQYCAVNAQNLTGKWEGYIFTSLKDRVSKSHLFFELKQQQRAVWGIYNKTSSRNNSKTGCLCSVSAILSKKQDSYFDIYKEKVEEIGSNYTFQGCDFINRLAVHYVIVDSIEYLVGKWYTAQKALALSDGSEGVFILKHVGTETARNIDSYFPKLEKFIRKGDINEDSDAKKSILIPDTFNNLNNEEKELVNFLRSNSSSSQ